MKIRKATIRDIDALSKLWMEFMIHIEELKKEKRTIKKNAITIWKKWARKSLQSSNFLVLVAEEDDILVGYSFLGQNDLPKVFEDNKRFYLYDAYLKKGYRKKGIMKKMLKEIESFCKSKNADYLSLQAEYENVQANKAWKSLGFKTDSINYYKRYK